MITRLSALVSREDKWYRECDKKIEPRYADKTSTAARRLSAEEKDRVEHMIEDARFSCAAIMDNFDARANVFLPPTGYAALWIADASFDAHVFDRNIFRGVAGVYTKHTREPKHDISGPLNAIMGDESPAPPLSPSAPSNWACSLGANAWIGFYRANLRNNIVAVVVAGLDSASWDALRTEMRAWHRRISVAEAYERMRPWAELAERNRARLLATFLRVSGIEPVRPDAMREITDLPYAPRATRFVDSCDWFRDARVPDWFAFPSRAPRGCSEMPGTPGDGVRVLSTNKRETYPFEVSVDFDVCLDDLYAFRENEYVRAAGCCNSKKPHVAVVYGPLNEMYIKKSAENASSPDTFNAVAAQATQNTDAAASVIAARDRVDGVDACWEDADLATNRLVSSTYDFRGTNASVDIEDRNVTILTPLWVRVSCRDSTDRAEPENEKRKRRLAALALDDYVPISR